MGFTRTRKGALIAKWDVESALPPVALTAHVDTLGAVVKEIKSNGRLRLSRIGGVEWPTVETEGVSIFASNGEKVRGSILVETVFAWPGIGRLTYEAVIYRDFPLLQATIILKSILILGINLGVDILYAYVDPRIRLA